jgi:glycosyltransferase involved in cell wall biosynthesis
VDVSVIIPTHNRRESAVRAVRSLLRQDFPPDCLEVIVCCDRCSDGTVEALQAIGDERVRVLRSPAAGPSAACNSGLRVARGRLGVFLDDEIEADERFVAAHVQAHQAGGGAKLAVVGYSRVVTNPESPPFLREIAEQYEAFFVELEARLQASGPGTPVDLCGSNFSTPIAPLRQIGGYNESFGFQRNDFELAVRLLQGGYRFAFARTAAARMHVAVGRADIVSRAADRARNDYALARAYPSCIPHLPFYRNMRDPRRRWRPWLWWSAGKLVAGLADGAATLLPSNLKIMRWAYAAKYYARLRQEVGTWSELCRLCLAPEIAPAVRERRGRL